MVNLQGRTFSNTALGETKLKRVKRSDSRDDGNYLRMDDFGSYYLLDKVNLGVEKQALIIKK